ncbi:hypothetical protein [Pollutibacter soli]|uniref:hypothetical protein n=1 Tax=Pollutibacter soli TaxID=3034157 RepID=UPI0030138096
MKRFLFSLIFFCAINSHAQTSPATGPHAAEITVKQQSIAKLKSELSGLQQQLNDALAATSAAEKKSRLAADDYGDASKKLKKNAGSKKNSKRAHNAADDAKKASKEVKKARNQEEKIKKSIKKKKKAISKEEKRLAKLMK